MAVLVSILEKYLSYLIRISECFDWAYFRMQSYKSELKDLRGLLQINKMVPIRVIALANQRTNKWPPLRALGLTD